MTATFDIQLEQSDRSSHFAYILLQKKPELARTFEKNFDVTFGKNQGGTLSFHTAPANESNVRNGFNILFKQFVAGKHLTKETIGEAASTVYASAAPAFARHGNDNALKNRFDGASQPRGASAPYSFEARDPAQEELLKKIQDNDVVFGLGPAGTGKTHVAIVKAVEMLKNHEIEKILLARPAQEAGEKLGYLPGDQKAKLDPYMRPLYDELTKVIGAAQLERWMSSGTVELVPIGLMRGRTFENAFVIVDEAQNCTREQTKMALTRLGTGSKMVLTGDPKQTDIVEDSGLMWAAEKLKGVEGIGHVVLTKVVRHPTVQRIVDALEGKSLDISERLNADAPKNSAPKPPKNGM